MPTGQRAADHLVKSDRPAARCGNNMENETILARFWGKQTRKCGAEGGALQMIDNGALSVIGPRVLSICVRNDHVPSLPRLCSSNPSSRSEIHPIPFRYFRR